MRTMRAPVVWCVLLLVVGGVVAKKADHHVVEHHHHHSKHQKRDLEEEEVVPVAVLGKIAGDLAINFAAGVLFDYIKDSSQSCVRVSSPMNTWKKAGDRDMVGDDMLRMCEERSMTFLGDASRKRRWHVHSHDLTLKQCLFEFEWKFRSVPTVYDCTKRTILKNHGQEALTRLEQTYPSDSYFTRYVGGIHVTIEDCDLNEHQGYVMVTPALPNVAFSTDKQDIINYHDNPYFYINVEGWTFGDCSGWKKPGVKWVFTYKIDPRAATVSYITQYTEDPRRPYINTYMYIPYLEDGASEMGKKQVLTYQEKTKAEAESLGINLKG